MIALAVTGGATARPTPEEAAIEVVRSSARIIAGAMDCGVAKDRALVVGQRAIDQAKLVAPGVPRQRLQNVHAGAFQAWLEQYGNAPQAECPRILGSYRELEDRLTVHR